MMGNANTRLGTRWGGRWKAIALAVLLGLTIVGPARVAVSQGGFSLHALALAAEIHEISLPAVTAPGAGVPICWRVQGGTTQQLAIRVHNVARAGGIWKPVSLVVQK